MSVVDVEEKLDEFCRSYEKAEQANRCVCKMLQSKVVTALNESEFVESSEHYNVGITSDVKFYTDECQNRKYSISFTVSISKIDDVKLPLKCLNEIEEVLPFPCEITPKGGVINLNFQVLKEV